MEKLAGVYQIKNIVNGKIYIGSSVNLMDRVWNHKAKLRNQTHKNPHLQAAWNKYGEGAFEFTVLEIVDEPADALIREQHYIDTLVPDYNVWKDVVATRLGDGLSDEHKRKISKSKKGKCVGKNNHFYGKHHSGETRKLLSKQHTGKKHSDETKRKITKAQIGEKSHYAKLTWDTVREVRRLFEEENWTENMLIEKFQMSQSAINKIVRYKTWRE